MQWYSQLRRCTGPCVFIDASETWQKQTTRNRCTIATANGPLTLTVPVEHPAVDSGVQAMPSRLLTRDIRISDHGRWRHLHWQALCSNYGKSAFFDYYADDLRPFFERKWTFLIDYNTEITQLLCRWLQLEKDVKVSTSPSGNSDMPVCHLPEYYQVYRERTGFLPNLSILDLLFNEGPQSILYL